MTRCPIRKDYPQCSTQCALYVNDQCAILSIAIDLDDIAEQLDEIKEIKYRK